MYASLLIWSLVPDRWADPWGILTQVQRIERSLRIFETDALYEYDNGYEVQHLPVWEDSKGARFVKPHPIDYGATARWRCLDPVNGLVWWTNRLTGRVLDELGNPVRIENGLPVMSSVSL